VTTNASGSGLRRRLAITSCMPAVRLS